MELEKQVCSLENAIKLQELGIKQDSLFYWTLGGVVYKSEMPFFTDSNYSVFTASELFELIPQRIILNENEPFNSFIFNMDITRIFTDDKLVKVFSVNYICDTVDCNDQNFPFVAQ